MNVLPIGRARQRLPELVRRVAQGHPPVGIGRRGKVEAILCAPPAPARTERRPLRGLVTLLDDDLNAGNLELLELFQASLSRTMAQLEGHSLKPRPRKARRR